MTKEERIAELMEDDTKYCCYCGNQKVTFSCCGENHFQTFSEMDEYDQAYWLLQEGYE